MTQFDILTLFPEVCDAYFQASILGRAQKKKLVKITTHNIRDFARDKHKKVDDTPYGGGPGMVLKPEPIARAVKLLKLGKESRVILLSAHGKMFDQKTARRLARYRQLIFICGRYEGVDERVAQHIADEEISIGNYVLTGGELPAMVIVDAVARHIPGVLGKKESREEERQGVGIPAYTRPEVFVWRGKKYKVPPVLLSGDHKKVEAWRKKQRKK